MELSKVGKYAQDRLDQHWPLINSFSWVFQSHSPTSSLLQVWQMLKHIQNVNTVNTTPITPTFCSVSQVVQVSKEHPWLPVTQDPLRWLLKNNLKKPRLLDLFQRSDHARSYHLYIYSTFIPTPSPALTQNHRVNPTQLVAHFFSSFSREKWSSIMHLLVTISTAQEKKKQHHQVSWSKNPLTFHEIPGCFNRDPCFNDLLKIPTKTWVGSTFIPYICGLSLSRKPRHHRSLQCLHIVVDSWHRIRSSVAPRYWRSQHWRKREFQPGQTVEAEKILEILVNYRVQTPGNRTLIVDYPPEN